jgi:hypothetical protein
MAFAVPMNLDGMEAKAIPATASAPEAVAPPMTTARKQ